MHTDITFFTQTSSINNLLQSDRHFTEHLYITFLGRKDKFSFKPVSVYGTFFYKKEKRKQIPQALLSYEI